MSLNINELPESALLRIFSLLTLRELCSVQVVCKCWYELIQDFSLWNDISIANDNQLSSILTEEMLGVWLARWNRHIKTLRLRYCRRLTNFTGHLIGNNCSQIASIDLQGCIGIGDYGIALIADRCSMLKKVNLFMTGITDVGFSDLVRKVPTISSVKLPSKGNCYRSLDSICSSCDSLDALILNDVIPFDETDPVVSDTIIKQVTTTFCMIRKISLNWCWYVTDECLTAIAENCQNLYHLVVRECHQVSDLGLNIVIKMCTKLRKLQLGRLYGVTDGLAQGFVGRRSSLQRLKLIDTSVTDKGISRILESTPAMLGLVLGEYCFNASKINGDLLFPCTKYCKDLVELVLISCKTVNDEMLFNIAENLSSLQTLCLSSCFNVTRAGLESMINNLRRLRILRICKCSDFDDVILDKAADNLTALVTVELYGCNKVTYEGVKSFLRKKPNCNVRL